MESLKEKAEEICRTLSAWGFNARVENLNLLEDFDGDVSEWEKRNRDHAAFVAASPRGNLTVQAEQDLVAYVKSKVGLDVTVNRYAGRLYT